MVFDKNKESLEDKADVSIIYVLVFAGTCIHKYRCENRNQIWHNIWIQDNVDKIIHGEITYID